MRIVTLKLFHMHPSFRMRNQTDGPRSIGRGTSRLAQVGIAWEAGEPIRIRGFGWALGISSVHRLLMKLESHGQTSPLVA